MPTPSPRKKGKLQQHMPRESAPSSSLTLTQPTSTRTSKRRKTKNPHKRKLSRLESLPSELLAQIFLENCNVALPRASPYLTRALSGEYVKRRYCEYILGQYMMYTGRDKQTVPHYGSFGDHADSLEPIRSPFALRWVTWNYVRDAAERLPHRVGHPISEMIEHSLIDRLKQGTTWVDPSTMPEGQPRRQWLKWAKMREGLERSPGAESYVQFLLGYLIPSKLLRWPISVENLDFLDFLVQGGCYLEQASKSLVGEIAAESALKAIEAKNYRLVHRLLGHGIEAPCSMDDIARAMGAISWDPPMFRLIERCHAITRSEEGEKLRARALAYHDGGQDSLLSPGGHAQGQALMQRWRGYPCPVYEPRSLYDQCIVCLRATAPHKARWHTIEEYDLALSVMAGI